MCESIAETTVFLRIQPLNAGIKFSSKLKATLFSQIPVVALILTAICIYAYYKYTSGRVYLLDFACYKPPKSLQVSRAMCVWGLEQFGKVDAPPFPFLRRPHQIFSRPQDFDWHMSVTAQAHVT